MGLDKIVSEIKPNIVRSYGSNSEAEICTEIGRNYNIPSVTSIHNLFPTHKIKGIENIICVSDAVKEKCLEIGIDKKKLIVISNGLDLNVFRNYEESVKVDELTEKYSGKYRIISVGRLVWQKNLENLIKASKIVSDKLEGFSHIHIGEFGLLKDRISELSREINHRDFYLIPNVDQKTLAHFYSWANLFVMASISEGFGIAYIESLACETPVITSDIAPMNSYVFDKFNGLLVNPDSPEDIAKKIIIALTDNELYSTLKSNARPSVIKFDINKVKKQEADFYKRI